MSSEPVAMAVELDRPGLLDRILARRQLKAELPPEEKIVEDEPRRRFEMAGLKFWDRDRPDSSQPEWHAEPRFETAPANDRENPGFVSKLFRREREPAAFGPELPSVAQASAPARESWLPNWDMASRPATVEPPPILETIPDPRRRVAAVEPMEIRQTIPEPRRRVTTPAPVVPVRVASAPTDDLPRPRRSPTPVVVAPAPAREIQVSRYEPRPSTVQKSAVSDPVPPRTPVRSISGWRTAVSKPLAVRAPAPPRSTSTALITKPVVRSAREIDHSPRPEIPAARQSTPPPVSQQIYCVPVEPPCW